MNRGANVVFESRKGQFRGAAAAVKPFGPLPTTTASYFALPATVSAAYPIPSRDPRLEPIPEQHRRKPLSWVVRGRRSFSQSAAFPLKESSAALAMSARQI